MSWFDTSGFASLAKTALKEAQKTIDKALDIKDEDPNTLQTVDNSQEFFSTWGLKEGEKIIPEECSSSHKQQNLSVWGSFTGSFFESQKDEMTAVTSKKVETFKTSNDSIEKLHAPITSLKSLSEKSKELPEIRSLDRKNIEHSIKDQIDDTSKISQQIVRENNYNECDNEKPALNNDSISSEDSHDISKGDNVKKLYSDRNEKEEEDTNLINRFITHSPQSNKKSSESVELIDPQDDKNTDCTNTPNSELNSVSFSISNEQRPPSESIEILSDSMILSPNSVDSTDECQEDENLLTLVNQEHSEIILNTSGQFLNIKDDVLVSNENFDGDDIRSSTSTLEEYPNIKKVNFLTQDRINSTLNLSSSENVEIITKDFDADEISINDDSFASASESTLTTVVESYNQDLRTISCSPVLELKQNTTLDFSKDRLNLVNLHLPLEAITRQPIRKNDYNHLKTQGELSPFDCLKNSMIEPLELTTISDNLKISDSCLMLTDSSCEETLVESSSEDNGLGDISKIHEVPLTSSSYVKNMLEEAMTEKQENSFIQADKSITIMPRENSPISSESRSDLVKIGSDQTSGHTSGDEIETTTSSDIEIISSPNGDSSSAQSRQSPAKYHPHKSCDLLSKALKTRGHSRELSEASIGSDDANLEIERLLRRIREMTEILEARESKLIEISRTNIELNEQNIQLKKQLDNKEKNAEKSQDLRQLTEDYTQRLSALERKFQQAIREKDSMKKSLDILKQEASSKLSSKEISTSYAEKDVIIKELREEGEKLSKQQLQHSNIIKKLRAKEKENDVAIKNQREQIEELSLELERLKRSLSAKEELERSQIEAIHTLTSKTKNQEKELMSLHEKLDYTINKMEVYKKSFEAAKSELLETKEKLMVCEEQLKLAAEDASESHQLLLQIENLKKKLRKDEESHIKKETLLKQENVELLKRLESVESRNEEISESMSIATKPLLRQIEQLQLSLSHKTNFYLKQEEVMSEKVADLEIKLENMKETNRTNSEENAYIKSRCSVLESKLSSKECERKKYEELYENLTKKNSSISNELEGMKQRIILLEQEKQNEIQNLKREIKVLENKLSIEKAATEAEKRKNNINIEQQQNVDEDLRYSPTLSIERDSISSANSIWPPFNDAVFETGSGRFPNVYNTNSTSAIENLQAQLKQRDGEIQQLQWELSRRNTERDALNSEVSNLVSKVEDLTTTVSEFDSLKENLNDIQTKYDALLQMYGEKLEETQELRLDLADVKEMYKTQIDQLLKREL